MVLLLPLRFFVVVRNAVGAFVNLVAAAAVETDNNIHSHIKDDMRNSDEDSDISWIRVMCVLYSSTMSYVLVWRNKSTNP